jgi:hypothetical protein
MHDQWKKFTRQYYYEMQNVWRPVGRDIIFTGQITRVKLYHYKNKILPAHELKGEKANHAN